MENERLTWDIDECARQIGVSRRTLMRRMKSDKIPSIKLGRRVLFRPDAINEWLKSKENKPKA